MHIVVVELTKYFLNLICFQLCLHSFLSFKWDVLSFSIRNQNNILSFNWKTKIRLHNFIKTIIGNLLVGQDDSSSEEVHPASNPTSNGKPAVPPRPRSISAVEFKRNGLPLNSALAANNKNAKSGKFNDEEPCKDSDVANADRMFCYQLFRMFLDKKNVLSYSIFNHCIFIMQWALSWYRILYHNCV